MPTARPSITARVTVVSPRLVKPLASRMPSAPTLTPMTPVSRGSPAASKRAEGHRQHEQRDHDAQALTHVGACVDRSGRPAVLDLQTGLLAGAVAAAMASVCVADTSA